MGLVLRGVERSVASVRWNAALPAMQREHCRPIRCLAATPMTWLLTSASGGCYFISILANSLK